MLSLPVSPIESLIFIAILIIWASLLFGGAIIGTPNQDKTRRMPVWTRLGSSFMLVIASWIWFAITQGTPVDVFAGCVAIGMTLGFIGDVFMAQVLPAEPHVLYGMVAFGLGHIAYIIGMGLIAYLHNIPYPNFIILMIWWLLAGIGWYIVVYRPAKKTLLVYAALPYALLLATTVGFAHSLTLLDTTFILVTIGAVLFLLSDLLLAAELFSKLHFNWIGDAIWLLYGPGQMLIVCGVLLFTLISSLLLNPV